MVSHQPCALATGCSIDCLRHPPLITDIELQCNNTIRWRASPACCEATYDVELIQADSQETCSDYILRDSTSDNSLSLGSECNSVCTVQINAVFNDGRIATSPCFTFNATSLMGQTCTYGINYHGTTCIWHAVQLCT